ncbi:hypothetical protein [Microbacterium sp. NPDC089696]|uniref:hypothetical protein n=1 Tax=Microbacterium sp. NPDC089696 TaxID=3364199 RepID=UPI00381D0AE5
MLTKKTAIPAASIVTLLVLVGCAPASESSSTPVASSPTASPTSPTPELTEPAVDLPTADTISCDSMLDPVVDEELRSRDLLPSPKPWTQFNFEPSGAALECPWGISGSVESAEYFAWSALSEGESDEFISLAEANGYKVTQDERGRWLESDHDVTPPLEPAVLVTDTWIAIANTPELIDAIRWVH